MTRWLRQLLWRLLAVLSLGLGLAGVVLPVLPTVPFLLLAAWAGGQGWPALERWLLAHPWCGPHIRRWRERGSVPRKAKWMATAMMASSALLLGFLPLPAWARAGAWLTMAAVGLWLWRRPED